MVGVPWNSVEVAAIVADYLDMLRQELRGESFNKAAHNRRLAERLDGRSGPSIEFKHANISAVLIELGWPYIAGYKPRSNYQELLAREVEAQIGGDLALQALATTAVETVKVHQSLSSGVADVFVPVPRLDKERAVYERTAHRAVLRTAESYLQREANNRRLGEAGELFVLEVEDRRLRASGLRRLADRIEHKSRTEGDGLGYDILSFDDRGAERFIEVKTTNFGAYMPFFASANEVRASSELAEHYSLYRVFGFRAEPKIFTLDGELASHVNLEPISYRARIR